MATKKSPKKAEAPKSEAAPLLKGRVSQSDQSALGVEDMTSEELEVHRDFNASARGQALPSRDNSEFAGNSAPRTWEQVYRENATDINIRAGAKPAKESK